MNLLTPLPIGPLQAPSRVMFGPHVTNLGDDDRRFTPRHTAYYARRAAGGCGLIVTEGASVHASDWPYERAPLADRCASGWSQIAAACHEHGAPGDRLPRPCRRAGQQRLQPTAAVGAVAGARGQQPRDAEVDGGATTSPPSSPGSRAAAELAIAAGCDGVEINAGQHSLVRQFLSGLTNHRGDAWGHDRLLFARQAIAAVAIAQPRGRSAPVLRRAGPVGRHHAGDGPGDRRRRWPSAGIDYLVVVRGSIYSAERTRPDFHQPPGLQHRRLPRRQGGAARRAGVPAGLGRRLRSGRVGDRRRGVRRGGDDPRPDRRPRPRRQAAIRRRRHASARASAATRRARCATPATRSSPASANRPAGRETEDPDWYAPTAAPRHVVVVGGGVAGLEAARVAATRGHRVTVVERAASSSAAWPPIAGPGRAVGRVARGGVPAARRARSRPCDSRCPDW